MLNLEQYATNNETAFYKNIPIAHLDEVRNYFKSKGVSIRVRYRGQRNHPDDKRPSYQRWNWCLPQFADRFSVYIEGKSNRVYVKEFEPRPQPRTLYEFHKAVITTAYCYANSLEEAQRMMGNGAMFVSMRKVGE